MARTWQLGAAALVACLFLYEHAQRGPVRTVTAAAPATQPSDIAFAADTVTTAAQSPPPPTTPPPPPPPPPLAAAPIKRLDVESCTSLSCATRHESLEPSWADLTSQPNIDWAHGGVRGDCVAGELEYIMSKYCDATPRKPRRGEKPWPSEERLAELDVHSQLLPQDDIARLVNLVGNRTLLLMGDSVMEQFYNALQCFLRKEGLERPWGSANTRWLEENAALWRLGKRKKPPKLPHAAAGGMRMAYVRVTVMMRDEVEAAVSTADVVVLNWGLHYQVMPQYSTELHDAFALLEAHAKQPRNVVVFQETGAQHFRMSDQRGYTTGEWEHRDKATDTNCGCQKTEDFNVNVRNRVLAEVLGGGLYPHLQTLPFYNLTRPRWRWHFGNCTQRPNGWNFYTCCDCTHFCYSPRMWKAHLHEMNEAIARGDAASNALLV